MRPRSRIMKVSQTHWGNLSRIPEQEGGISSCTCRPCPAEKTLVLQPVLPTWPSFSASTVGLTNVRVRPPRTARPSAAVPTHHDQGYLVKNPLTVLHRPSHCWAYGNIPKMVFCATETPAWKIPAASISSSQAATPNCFAARFCVTKGISPANMTFG